MKKPNIEYHTLQSPLEEGLANKQVLTAWETAADGDELKMYLINSDSRLLLGTLSILNHNKEPLIQVGIEHNPGMFLSGIKIPKSSIIGKCQCKLEGNFVFSDGKSEAFEAKHPLRGSIFTSEQSYLDYLDKRAVVKHFAIHIKKEVKIPKGKKTDDGSNRRPDIEIGYGRILDLHAHSLGLNTMEMTSFQILQEQIKRAEKHFDKALINNLDQIELIHGKGDGKLRKKLKETFINIQQVTKIEHDFHRSSLIIHL